MVEGQEIRLVGPVSLGRDGGRPGNRPGRSARNRPRTAVQTRSADEPPLVRWRPSVPGHHRRQQLVGDRAEQIVACRGSSAAGAGRHSVGETTASRPCRSVAEGTARGLGFAASLVQGSSSRASSPAQMRSVPGRALDHRGTRRGRDRLTPRRAGRARPAGDERELHVHGRIRGGRLRLVIARRREREGLPTRDAGACDAGALT